MHILKDGRVDFNEDLGSEELQLLQGWYNGQWDPLYALQSSGTLNKEDLNRAACNLAISLKHMNQEEQSIAQSLICMLEFACHRYCLNADED